jgi:UDP-N-acetylmuramoylalanine--D-glutamate ligase
VELKGKKAIVLGMGVSGLAACRFLLHAEADVTASDLRAKVIAEREPVKKLMASGLKITEDLEAFNADILVVSPGVPKSHPLYLEAARKGKPIIGEAELGISHIPLPIVGITGTNGKTTVTEMAAHILKDNGIKAHALGNNGAALTDWVVDEAVKEGIVIAELSSYQIETLATPVFDAAVILNISPDHFDRYPSFHDYAAAKFRLQEFLKPGAPFYVHPDLNQEKAISYLTDDLCIKPPFSFEDENRLACYHLVKHFGITKDQFKRSCTSFQKPPHRLEFIREIKGVSYYNDSKGTNVDSVIKAVDSFSGKIILIAGGKDKGVSFDCWVKPFTQKVLCVCAIGEAKDKLYRELSSSVTVKTFERLSEALDFAHSAAKEGDTILLSPGCSSFDQYENFEERGNEFKKLVRNLCGKII